MKLAAMLEGAERAALRPPDREPCNQWVERHRVLDALNCAEPGPINLDVTPYVREILDAWGDRSTREIVLMGGTQWGKPLALDTPIPTPAGWSTMGELQVGDLVFGRDGQPVTVTGASPVHHGRECFRVVFSDHNEITADAEHRWYVESTTPMKPGWPKRGPGPRAGIMTTAEIAKTLHHGSRGQRRNRFSIPVAGALKLPPADLPIDPYVLGAWLGDGHSVSSRISCHRDDAQHFAAQFIAAGHDASIVADGVRIDPKRANVCPRGHHKDETGWTGRGCAVCGRVASRNFGRVKRGLQPDPRTPIVMTMSRLITAHNLFGNKHVPAAYLRASHGQRLALLQGLMDTDGHIRPDGHCEFVNTNPRIAEAFGELLASLGLKHTVAIKHPYCRYKGKVSEGEQAWRFKFTAYADTPIFRLPRKLARMKAVEGSRATETRRRRIVAVEPTTSVPVRCIMTDAPDHLFLAGRAMIPTHNTETLLNVLFWSIDQDPKPTLVVLPIEDDVAPFVQRRLASAIEHCEPVRARHVVTKEHEVAFDGMMLYFGWSNSPSKLASKSVGNLLLDEVDKFPAFAGKEADPISLARERLRWFADSKLLASSTPTTKEGYVWRLWQRSDRRWFHLPCPQCGRFFALDFYAVVHWPTDEKDADKIREKRLAWVECPFCATKIADDVATKRRMMLGGVWCPEGGEVTPAGKVSGVKTHSARRGYHLNALYSPRLSWSDVAAEFIEARDDQARLLNFTNSWRGWPWLEQAEELKHEHLLALRTGIPPGVVPDDAVVVTAGVDWQKGRRYYVIRAWGVGERSWLIASGSVESNETLAEVVFHTTYKKQNGEPMQVRLACVDAGYDTDEVYGFCSQFPDLARPTKGHRAGRIRAGVPIVPTRVRRDWLGRSTTDLLVWNLDVSFFQDKLHRMLQAPLGAPGALALNADPSDDHLRHLIAEKKRLVRDKKRRTISHQWIADGPNHLRDCEVYALAAAEMLGVWSLRDAAAGERAALVYRAPNAAPTPHEPSRRRSFGFRSRRAR